MGIREFGARVRVERERLGLSKADVARRVGIDASYVRRLENGDRAYKSIGRDVLRRYAATLSLPEPELGALLYDEPLPRPLVVDAPLPVALRIVAQASAGGGHGARSERGDAFAHDFAHDLDGFVYVHPDQARGRLLKAVRVEGECLFPSLQAGDVVVLDCTPGVQPKLHQIVAATIKHEGADGRYVFKRWGGIDAQGYVLLTRDDGEAAERVSQHDVQVEGVYYLLVTAGDPRPAGATAMPREAAAGGQ
jgi:transcriptional regulator with XRE-family HTH domain